MTALEATPPDLAADIVDQGVMLTGGVHFWVIWTAPCVNKPDGSFHSGRVSIAWRWGLGELWNSKSSCAMSLTTTAKLRTMA